MGFYCITSVLVSTVDVVENILYWKNCIQVVWSVKNVIIVQADDYNEKNLIKFLS